MTPEQRAAMQDAIDTLGYYASVCNEDDQDTPAKRAQAALCAALAESTPVQEPVAWWKQYPDGNVSVVGGKVFLTEDALYRGWRPLGFADAAPADVPLKPNGDDE